MGAYDDAGPIAQGPLFVVEGLDGGNVHLRYSITIIYKFFSCSPFGAY
jgi:hypothetical protein